jgi:hypothetical protein
MSVFPSGTDKLEGDRLTVSPGYTLDDLDCKIVIFYHGIRDYGLLFPSITPLTLQARMGEFYREAEIAFDAAAWLTFMLMCGALFEGILFHKMGANKNWRHLLNPQSQRGKLMPLLQASCAKSESIATSYGSGAQQPGDFAAHSLVCH